MRRPFHGQVSDESGATLIFVALAIVVLLGMAALAVDLGMLYGARGQSQRTADLSALAGAGELIFHPTDASRARQTARTFAAKNTVYGHSVALQDGDVEVFLDEQKVRVTVHNTRARTNAVATLFARVLGRDSADVVTVAAAEAYPAGAVACEDLLPVAMPDRWIQGAGGTSAWDPAEGDVYVSRDEASALNPYTGYTLSDFGLPILLKPSQGGTSGGGQGGGGAASGGCGDGRFEPGWWCEWLPEDGSNGGAAIRDHIKGQGSCTGPISKGDLLNDKNGNVQGPTRQGFEFLLNGEDADHWFDHGCDGSADAVGGPTPSVGGCVRDGAGNVVTSSSRLRAVPLFDPRTYVKQGNGDNFQVVDFAGVFVDSLSSGTPGQVNVWVTLTGFTGMDPVGDGGDGSTTGPLVKALRIIE